jgi:putative transposase
VRSFKFRIYPTKPQCNSIARCLGLCRFLYNCALEERNSAWSKHHISRSRKDQDALLPEIKELFPEFNQVYSQSLQNTLKRLDLAFQNFFRRVKLGENPGYPRFKSKDRYHSFTYPQSGFRIEGNRIFLSKIGHVKINQHRQIEGKIKTCSVIRTSTGKYYVCLTAERETLAVKPIVEARNARNPVGIDLGIKQYVTLSDGTVFANTVPSIDKQLAKLQRKKEQTKRGAARRAALKLWIAKLHEKNCNRRADFQHKLSRKLVDKYDLIAMEDLNIPAMQAAGLPGLNKLIGESAWTKLEQMISYKAEDAGKKLVLVDPANTSQTCSKCGHVNIKKLKLKDRIFVCENCGHKENRDFNASKNILIRGLAENRQALGEIGAAISDRKVKKPPPRPCFARQAEE